PAVVIGIAREHHHRPAVDAREPGCERLAPAPADLEEGAVVDERLDDGADLVDLARVLGDRVAQLRLVGARPAPGVGARRQLVHRARTVRQDAARALEGLPLGAALSAYRAVAGVDPRAAGFLLAPVLAGWRHHRRARHEELRGLADDDGVVACGDAGRAHAG